MTKIITFTSDFGDQFAAAQVKAVAYSADFSGHLIENHSVTPFSINEGAFQILTVAKFTPEGTVHVGVVDPGVGSNRAGIIIRTRSAWLVGPDNGLLYPTARLQRIVKIWKLNKNWFGQVSPTFHGRDIFIKSAVLLTRGQLPASFGCKCISKITKLEFAEKQVVHIDNYGNVKINGNGHLNLPKVKTFSDLSPGQAGLLWGSSDTWEIVVNRGSARDKFRLKLGQIVKNL